MLRAFNSFYVGSGMKGNAFLPRGFGDADDRRERTRMAASRRVPSELLGVLRAQNESLPTSELRDHHLRLLAEAGTAVVATGQQVGLFLGPLYTIYKAASAIAIARALTAETGVPCIPLFWLQTEDHDFAEIATSFTPVDDASPLELRLADEPGQERRSIGDRVLGPDVTGLINELEPALSGLPAAEEVLALLRAEYRPGVAPGRAFAGVLASLFAEDGLVIFDPRCAVASKLATPILRKALVDAGEIDTLLAERGRTLQNAGFKEQIEPRPGSPLTFFHQRDETGPRFRLGRRESGYTLLGAEEAFSERELLAIQERQPLRFSTSALLRPLFQDSLFPTAVYVGGPAEVSYFAQLAPLYAEFGLELPLIAERAHFRMISPRARGLLTKLGIAAADLDAPRGALLERLSTADVSDEAAPGPAWSAELEARLDAVLAREPMLEKAVDRTRRSVRRAMERFTARHRRTVLGRDDVLAARLARLDSSLRPGGHLQERVLSFPAFAARVGLRELRRLIVDAIDPFDPSMREIDL